MYSYEERLRSVKLYIKYDHSISSGGVQSFISLTRVREYWVLSPPYEEHIRIASRIEQILPLCERLK